MLVYRHPIEVALSLLRRGAEVDLQALENPALALEAWRIHNQAILDFYRQHPGRCVPGHIRALTADLDRCVATCSTKLDLPPASEGVAVHNAALRAEVALPERWRADLQAEIGLAQDRLLTATAQAAKLMCSSTVDGSEGRADLGDTDIAPPWVKVAPGGCTALAPSARAAWIRSSRRPRWCPSPCSPARRGAPVSLQHRLHPPESITIGRALARQNLEVSRDPGYARTAERARLLSERSGYQQNRLRAACPRPSTNASRPSPIAPLLRESPRLDHLGRAPSTRARPDPAVGHAQVFTIVSVARRTSWMPPS